MEITPAELTPKKSAQTVKLMKGTVLLDQETIGYVTGGKDALHLELSNDFTMIATDSSGEKIPG